MQPAVNFAPPVIDWHILMPHLLVALGGIFGLMWEIWKPRQQSPALANISIVTLLLTVALLAIQLPAGVADTAAGMVYRDPFVVMMQIAMVVGAILTLLFSESYLREKRISYGEFYPLVMWSLFGAMLMAGTKNLLMMFVGLEILSIALYVLAGLSRNEDKSEESALKYFLLGAFSTGFLLYGIAFLYGASGSLNLEFVWTTWSTGSTTVRSLLVFGLAMILIGLGFKASFVPFHQWTPDVYQGAPTNVTAYMATTSKIAAFAALFHVLDACLSFKSLWLPAVAVMAALTMTVGNLLALVQKDVKRMLGYSSIANAGYILVGALAHFQDPARVGTGTVAFYLLSYSLMTIGAFGVITLTAKSGREGTTLQDLHGLYQRAPIAAISLVIIMCSLIGIPPFAGFFAKFYVLSDALTANLTWLAIFVVVNSVISLFYYLQVMWAVFVEEETADTPSRAILSPGLAGVCVLCAAGLVGGSLGVSPIIDILAR